MKYICRVCSEPSVSAPTPREMEQIAVVDSRWHNAEFTTQRYADWAAHMQKRGYDSAWLVARESWRVIAHIWYVMRAGTVTVLNVMTCAYAATKIQVAAMLLEAEDIFEAAGAHTVCYLDEPDGTPYDDVFEALGYEKVPYSKQPAYAADIPSNSSKAVRWRTITEGSRDQRALCLDPSLSTRFLSPPAS